MKKKFCDWWFSCFPPLRFHFPNDVTNLNFLLVSSFGLLGLFFCVRLSILNVSVISCPSSRKVEAFINHFYESPQNAGKVARIINRKTKIILLAFPQFSTIFKKYFLLTEFCSDYCQISIRFFRIYPSWSDKFFSRIPDFSSLWCGNQGTRRWEYKCRKKLKLWTLKGNRSGYKAMFQKPKNLCVDFCTKVRTKLPNRKKCQILREDMLLHLPHPSYKISNWVKKFVHNFHRHL